MRVNQFAESVDLFLAAKLDRADLNDVVGTCARAGSFEVERYEYVFSDSGQLSVFFLRFGDEIVIA